MVLHVTELTYINIYIGLSSCHIVMEILYGLIFSNCLLNHAQDKFHYTSTTLIPSAFPYPPRFAWFTFKVIINVVGTVLEEYGEGMQHIGPKKKHPVSIKTSGIGKTMFHSTHPNSLPTCRLPLMSRFKHMLIKWVSEWARERSHTTFTICVARHINLLCHDLPISKICSHLHVSNPLCMKSNLNPITCLC